MHWRIPRGRHGILRAPSGVHILSFSCSFRQKIEKNETKNWENPGSTTVMDQQILWCSRYSSKEDDNGTYIQGRGHLIETEVMLAAAY